jgi:hypothetical protein
MVYRRQDYRFRVLQQKRLESYQCSMWRMTEYLCILCNCRSLWISTKGLISWRFDMGECEQCGCGLHISGSFWHHVVNLKMACQKALENLFMSPEDRYASSSTSSSPRWHAFFFLALDKVWTGWSLWQDGQWQECFLLSFQNRGFEGLKLTMWLMLWKGMGRSLPFAYFEAIEVVVSGLLM